MKHATLALLFATAFAAFAQAEHESGGRRAATAVVIDFASLGSGIDTETQDAVLAIAAETTRQGKLMKLTVETYGFEGERKLCLEFKDFQIAYKLQNDVMPELLQKTRAKSTKSQLTLNCGGPAPKPHE